MRNKNFIKTFFVNGCANCNRRRLSLDSTKLAAKSDRQSVKNPYHSYESIQKTFRIPNPLECVDFATIRTDRKAQFRLLNGIFAPLFEMSYDDQLVWKFERNLFALKLLSFHLQKQVLKCVLNENGLLCDLEPVRPSPDIYHYRNKVEYNPGTALDGTKKSVGHLVTVKTPRGQKTLKGIIPLDCDDSALVTVDPMFAKFAQIYQDYIRTSDLPVSDYIWRVISDPVRTTRTGNFRELLIRKTLQGDYMVTTIFHPQELTEPEVQEESQRLRDFFLFECDRRNLPLHSLYFQSCKYWRCCPVRNPFQLLHGQSHIYERLRGKAFRISPRAFFQVNTRAAEILLNAIEEVCQFSECDTTLLDLCCGTGVYSICFADKVKHAIGIDVENSCIQDARFNADYNGVYNAQFLHENVDTAVPKILENLDTDHEKVVAIVNPSRYGLDGKVVMALRRFKKLKKLVYVSCNPFDKSLDNFFRLCCAPTDKYGGKPFRFKRVIPVDLFPHTVHCELVILLERE